MKAWQALKTAASIYGALLFWVGTWDLLYYWGTCAWYRELGYALTGLVLTAGSDTLAANGAIGGGWMRPEYKRRPGVHRARVACGLFGSLFLWVGLFDLMAEYTLFNSFDPGLKGTTRAAGKDVAMLVAGMAALRALGVYYEVCGVAPPDRLPRCYGGCRCACSAGARALASVCAQCAVWLGTWNVLEDYSRVTLGREVAYAAAGLVLCLLAGVGGGSRGGSRGSSVGHPGDARGNARGRGGCVCAGMDLEARALAALIGQFIHITGVWTLLDVCAGHEASVLRNGFYLVAGVGLMAATGSLHTHACVSVAPMALGDTLDHYRFARDAAVPLLGSTRPGSPGEETLSSARAEFHLEREYASAHGVGYSSPAARQHPTNPVKVNAVAGIEMQQLQPRHLVSDRRQL